MQFKNNSVMSSGTIVFLAANASYSHTNIAGWYLREYGTSAGWDWHEVETLPTDSMADVMQRVLRLNPDILAASFYLFNVNLLLSFISRFKALKPDCLVIGGGPEFLGDNLAFLKRHPEINIVIRGEGERAFAAWLERCKNPEEWKKIKGACALIGDKYIDNGKAELTDDLDKIPSPFRERLSGFKKPFLLLETSRGCSNACAFCTSAGAPVRFFSPARTRGNLALVAAAGVREVRLADRTFNENHARCLSLVKIMRDEFENMRFHLEIDPARLSNEVIAELGRAGPGRFHLEVGIQTTNPEVYRAVDRAGSMKRTLAVLKQLCLLRNLSVHVDLIAGLPGATLADLYADLHAVILMQPDEIQLELLKILPGTRLNAEKDKWGIISASDPPYEILRSAAMSPDDLLAARRLSRIVDWCYNARELRRSFMAAMAIPRFFEHFADFTGSQTAGFNAPALENRFKLLELFFARHAPALIPGLGYEWLKCGLSPQHGICRTTRWKEPLPREAVFIEGDATAKPCRIFLANLGRDYLFVYGQGTSRKACAVYVLPHSEMKA